MLSLCRTSDQCVMTVVTALIPVRHNLCDVRRHAVAPMVYAPFEKVEGEDLRRIELIDLVVVGEEERDRHLHGI